MGPLSAGVLPGVRACSCAKPTLLQATRYLAMTICAHGANSRVCVGLCRIACKRPLCNGETETEKSVQGSSRP